MIRPCAPALALLLATGCDQEEAVPANVAVAEAAPADPAPVAEPRGAVVIVGVAGVEPGGEPVEVALQTEGQWGTDEATYRARVPADADAVALRLEGVVPGRYGVVAVQPNLPATSARSTGPARKTGAPSAADGPATVAPLPTGSVPPAPLSAKTAGGWAASGAESRSPPEWADAEATIGAEGTTVPLTLLRR